MRAPSHSSTRRHSRATTRRRKSDLSGPSRSVVYIFEREGVRGGAHWLLVLDCGHVVARKRFVAKSLGAQIGSLFRPLHEKLAPRHVQCHTCASGQEKIDPAVMIRAFGGELL